MKRNTIKTGAVCALFTLATACFSPQNAVAQSTCESIAEKFYAAPPFATGGKISMTIREPALLNADKPRVLQGQYLARAGDCIGCHTRPGGAPFAGGLPLKTPFGVIVSTNITPAKNDEQSKDRKGGLGNYTQAQFSRLMREGINHTGQNIYPAMPYASYARLSDDDLAALYAYFTQGIAPVVQTNPQTNLPWPFSMRWLVKAWNWLYLPKPGYTAVAKQSAEWNRGAYLVQSLGHCGACHTPRNLAGAEKANSEKKSEFFLSGAVIDGWYAQNLRSPNDGVTQNQAGLTNWTKQDLVEYLKTGHTAHTAAFGAMTEVVSNSTQHLTTADASAIAVYLKSLGSTNALESASESSLDTGVVKRPAQSADTSSPTAAALRSGQVNQSGALVYLNNCAGCHQSSGKGANAAFPSLAQSSTVAASNPTSLIRIVLQGANRPATAASPSALAMPGLDWRLSDANVADVLSFVRSNWGNRAEAVSPAEVAKVRKALAATP
jgi:mono/diheme cytochrome c family protein